MCLSVLAFLFLAFHLQQALMHLCSGLTDASDTIVCLSLCIAFRSLSFLSYSLRGSVCLSPPRSISLTLALSLCRSLRPCVCLSIHLSMCGLPLACFSYFSIFLSHCSLFSIDTRRRNGTVTTKKKEKRKTRKRRQPTNGWLLFGCALLFICFSNLWTERLQAVFMNGPRCFAAFPRPSMVALLFFVVVLIDDSSTQFASRRFKTFSPSSFTSRQPETRTVRLTAHAEACSIPFRSVQVLRRSVFYD